MKHSVTFLISVSILLIGSLTIIILPLSVNAFNIPPEPGWDKLVRIRILFGDRLAIAYDRDPTDELEFDYLTLRDIAPNGDIRFYPCQYFIDRNKDGMMDEATEIFIDKAHDGLNGNEMSLSAWLEQQEKVETAPTLDEYIEQKTET